MRKLSYLNILNDTGATRLSLVRDINTGHYFMEKYLAVQIEFQKELFENEINIHSRLKNKYVIEFVERISDGSFLMEYAPHGNLDLKFPENREKKVAWSIQFLTGLSYIHELGYVHNDIKPSNILITKDSRAKLSDFAFSGKVGEKSFENMPDYFIPGSDYFRPNPDIKYQQNSKSNDIYSVGVVLYLLFSGGEKFNKINIELIEDKALKKLAGSCLNGSVEDVGKIVEELKRVL